MDAGAGLQPLPEGSARAGKEPNSRSRPTPQGQVTGAAIALSAWLEQMLEWPLAYAEVLSRACLQGQRDSRCDPRCPTVRSDQARPANLRNRNAADMNPAERHRSGARSPVAGRHPPTMSVPRAPRGLQDPQVMGFWITPACAGLVGGLPRLRVFHHHKANSAAASPPRPWPAVLPRTAAVSASPGASTAGRDCEPGHGA